MSCGDNHPGPTASAAVIVVSGKLRLVRLSHGIPAGVTKVGVSVMVSVSFIMGVWVICADNDVQEAINMVDTKQHAKTNKK